MQLLVDVGNSNLKWALWGPDGHVSGHVLRHADRTLEAGELQSALSLLPAPEKVKVSNVAGKAVADLLTRACDALWGLSPRFASSQKSGYGVTIAYERAEMLGVDRWLALVAAYNRSPAPSLIVDCGTAVTLDAIDGLGRHLGGIIMPGEHMMWNALFGGTRMAAVAYQPFSGLLGHNTAECVASGTLHSTVGLVERVHRQLAESHPQEWKILLTGGGAPTVADQLDMAAEQRPHLVFEGLAIV
jgi:type III pantothenate kinase